MASAVSDLERWRAAVSSAFHGSGSGLISVSGGDHRHGIRGSPRVPADERDGARAFVGRVPTQLQVCFRRSSSTSIPAPVAGRRVVVEHPSGGSTKWTSAWAEQRAFEPAGQSCRRVVDAVVGRRAARSPKRARRRQGDEARRRPPAVSGDPVVLWSFRLYRTSG